MNNDSITLKKYNTTIFCVLALPVLYLISRYNYNLFHSLADGVSIVIAACIFTIIWNGRRIVDNDYFLYVGIAFLFFAFLDLMHLLGNKNMGVFPEYGNLGPALYIATRYILSISLMIAPLFINRKLNTTLMFVLYSLVTSLILLSIFYWRIFPVCVVEGVGLTPFKILSDYIICLFLLGAIGLLLIKRRSFDSRVLWIIVSSIILSIITGLAFTLYADAFGIMNMAGHLFQIASFYLFYLAFIETSLTKPQDILYLKLKQREEKLAENVQELDYVNIELKQEIAERKRAEEALCQSENRLRATLDATPFPVAVVDLQDDKIFYWSESALKLFGHTATTTSEWYKIAYPEPAYRKEVIERWKAFLEKARESGQPLNTGEYQVTCKDGSVRICELYATFLPDNLIITFNDITERKQTEEALRESEERFRVAFLANPSAVAISRQEDGVWIDVNQAALDIFGYTREEVIGKSALDANLWVDPKDRQRIVLALGRRGGGVKNQEVRLRRKDGSVIIASVSAQALTLKGVKHFLLISEDITEHKQAEEAARYAMKVSQALNRINEMVHGTLDFDQIIQNILSEGTATLGCESAAVSLRQDHTWIVSHVYGMPGTLIGSRMNDEQERHTVLAVQSRNPVTVDDTFNDDRFNREHFRRHNIHAVMVAPLVAHDDPFGAIFFNYHKGPHKFTEAEVQFVRQLLAMASVALKNARLFAENMQTNQALQKTRDELELRVQERTAELQKANVKLIQSNRQLEELNKELQDFAFIASHDLQEPLRKVQTFGDMLADGYSATLDETFKDYLNRMQNAAKRMRDLLDSLLAYSRVATKAEPLKATDLKISVEKALSNLEIMIEEKNARVEVQDLPTIRTDPVQMIQLFQNLIGNALKFHQQDKAPHVKVYMRLKNENGAYEICVEDNGLGFEEEYLDKIFLPFQRLHGRSSIYEGMGMGLAICKKIVERHGGEITAKSEVGKGSTFIVSFPAKKNQL